MIFCTNFLIRRVVKFEVKKVKQPIIWNGCSSSQLYIVTTYFFIAYVKHGAFGCVYSRIIMYIRIYADIYFETNVMSHKNLIDTTNYIIPMNICLAKTTCELHLDVTWEKWLSSFENNKICEMTQTRDDIVRWQPNLASYPAAIED